MIYNYLYLLALFFLALITITFYCFARYKLDCYIRTRTTNKHIAKLNQNKKTLEKAIDSNVSYSQLEIIHSQFKRLQALSKS